MDAVELVRQLARGGRIMELKDAGVRVFRVWQDHTTTLIKVYPSPGAARREERAFGILTEVTNLPQIMESGAVDDLVWARFRDPGHWTIATLPHNFDAAEQAGKIIASLQRCDAAGLSNLSQGISADQVRGDYASVFNRLARYRGRFGMSQETLDAALAAPPPVSSEPVAAHTTPIPGKFFVTEDGTVTLFDWGWATLAPPEWDATFAWWSFLNAGGPEAASAFEKGFGSTIRNETMRPWIIYHIGTTLLRAAENQSGRLDSLSPMVVELSELVGA